MKKLAISISLTALLISTGVQAQNVGETAPDFTLDKLSGGSWTLSDFSGKVISIFVFGFNCGFCETAAPTLQKELVDNYAGVEEYVAIAIDAWDGSVTAVQQFKDKTGMTIPMLLNGSSFASLYDTPHDRLLVINANGTLVHKGTGQANSDRINAIEKINAELGSNAPTAIENFNAETGSFSASVFPNPARENLTLRIDIPSSGMVSVQIVGIDGRVLGHPVNEEFVQGNHDLNLRLDGLSAGMYYSLIRYNDQTISSKFIIE